MNSGRWLQWHWKGAEPPGEAKSDIEIMAKIYVKVKEMYAAEGGKLPEPIANIYWPYAKPDLPDPEEIAKEINGRAIEDLPDPTDPLKPPILKAGQQLAGFAQLRDDGKTAAGCWIYTGCFTEKGNMMARRDNADPTDSGLAPNWAFSWPANRRILYNRASCDLAGNPYNPKHALVNWNGEKWVGVDVPDFPVTNNPETGAMPFIMNAEGVSRLFTRGMMRDGPFPEHYEPFESPVPNPLHPEVSASPVARLFPGVADGFGKPDKYPIVATSYRLTEHFHFWSKHVLINAILQPQQFVEMGEELAKEKGIASGDWVEVSSAHGQIKAVAVVTKRIKQLTIDGKIVHTLGVPIHWGFTGSTKKGYAANTLTPFVGDANIETPEYKAFLVDVVKSTPAVS